MTDNEIIKALKCCFINSDCNGCPLAEPQTFECLKNACTNAIQLIDRQKAEIERLKNENFGLGTERDAAMECMDTAVIEAKSEAIREFAKEFVADLSHMLTYDKDYIKAKIFNLVEQKEMVGDECGKA